MPPGGPQQITNEGRGSHAREGTSFAGTRPSVIHRGGGEGQAALVLVPEDEDPLEDEPPDDEPFEDEPLDDEPLDDEPFDDDEEESDDEDDSDFAGTELLPVDRLSLR